MGNNLNDALLLVGFESCLQMLVEVWGADKEGASPEFQARAKAFLNGVLEGFNEAFPEEIRETVNSVGGEEG